MPELVSYARRKALRPLPQETDSPPSKQAVPVLRLRAGSSASMDSRAGVPSVRREVPRPVLSRSPHQVPACSPPVIAYVPDFARDLLRPVMQVLTPSPEN